MMKEKVMAKIPAVASRNRDMENTVPPMLLRWSLKETQSQRDQRRRPRNRAMLNRKPDEARVSSTMPHAARRSHRYL